MYRYRVLSTGGSDEEMGRLHGEAFREDARAGMLDFYLRLWRRILDPHGMSPFTASVVKKVTGVAAPQLLKLFAGKVPGWLDDRMNGMQSVLKLDDTAIRTALVLPDLLPFLQSLWVTFRPDDFVAVNLPSFGCTSFVASGDRFFVGRNLDFPGVGYWDRFPVIQHFKRTKGLSYLGFTTAGVPVAGITGINEARIVVTIHQHYSRKATFTGELPFSIGERILRECQSVDEAKAILDGAHVSSSWAFVIADGKNRDAMLYELSPRGRGSRRLDGGYLGHSNHFQTPVCQAGEYATGARMNWDNRCRRTRLEELLAKAGDGLDENAATQILCDHWDPFWDEPKVANRTVSQVYNIQSVLIDPVEMKAWLGEGKSPLHLGHYAEFDLSELFAGRDGRTGRELPAYRFADPGQEKAKRLYISSFVDAFEGRDEAALPQMDECLKAHPFAEAYLVTGILSLRARNEARAVTLFQDGMKLVDEKCRAKGLTERPPEYFELMLYEARSYDLLGQRPKAVEVYRRLAADERNGDLHLKEMALKAKPFTRAWLERIWMPYAAYIPFQ